MSPRIGLNFNELLKTAIQIVDNEGWDHLTISYLAKQLTIQPPSIYNHVKNLDELKNSIALYGIQALYKELHASISDQSKEAIFALAIAYIHFARKHPGLYESTLSSTHTVGEQYTLVANQILALIFEVLKPYDLNEIEQIHIVRGLRSILHGFVSLEDHDGFGINIPIDESIIFVLKRYLQNVDSIKSK